MLAICESLSTRLDRGLAGGLGTAEASATLAGAAGAAGFGVASTMTGAYANASIRDTGSTAASAQSAGKRKFTLSDGARSASAMSPRAMSARAVSAAAATIVDDAAGCSERPSRALKPAARPPTPAPPRMARHASTLLLIPQDRPRMSPRTADPAPNVASSSLQTERNYGCAGTFLRRLSPCPRGG